MHLVTYRIQGSYSVGALVGDVVYDVFKCSPELGRSALGRRAVRDWQRPLMLCVLAEGAEGMRQAAADVETIAGQTVEPKPPVSYQLADVQLCAPLTQFSKLMLLAGNYAAHVEEGGSRAPDKDNSTPRVFMKPPSTTVIGPGEPILIPPNAVRIAYELELAAVIARRARFVPAEQALQYVGGYTIVNDVSERELRIGVDRSPREGDSWFDWLNGKWFDTFAPMGPCIATADEIPDPQTLDMELRVNGQLCQRSNTRNMIFSVAELVAFISTLVTLEPGDVISTGTPERLPGCAADRLRPGDVVECEIEKIGLLRNPVCAAG